MCACVCIGLVSPYCVLITKTNDINKDKIKALFAFHSTFLKKLLEESTEGKKIQEIDN